MYCCLCSVQLVRSVELGLCPSISSNHKSIYTYTNLIRVEHTLYLVNRLIRMSKVFAKKAVVVNSSALLDSLFPISDSKQDMIKRSNVFLSIITSRLIISSIFIITLEAFLMCLFIILALLIIIFDI